MKSSSRNRREPKRVATLLLTLFLASTPSSEATCPYASLSKKQSKTKHHHRGKRALQNDDGGIPDGGFAAVSVDLANLMFDSQDFWPADFGNYGPLFIRLAWHCAGSYRVSDGRGGCDGGRIRFSPELTWDDNKNLDKALQLLEPIKAKYGSKLSWADLIALSGNVAIENMRGPVLGFCGGRRDDIDGSDSIPLGPSDVQATLYPCEVDGICTYPLGSRSTELIYVNPEGPMGIPDPAQSAVEIRSTFKDMGMDDTETVALVGGGHTFGKMHGPCANPPCGDGKGLNTHTSGFEGVWTQLPTMWSTLFFTNLINFTWKKVVGPGGRFQFVREDDPVSGIIMLTSDLALIADPEYDRLSREFADDQLLLEEKFKLAWYKLMTLDMGPASRCIGDLVPPPQAFQNPLPDAPNPLTDYVPIHDTVQAMIKEDVTLVERFVTLAFNCANTFRQTDYTGGCNGARIQFEPELSWPVNAGMEEVLFRLQIVREDDNYEISMSDLIVLAGQIALEYSGGNDIKFCGGRTDATDGKGHPDHLKPGMHHSVVTTATVRDEMYVRGFTARELVALSGRPRRNIYKTTSDYYTRLLANANGVIPDDGFTPEELIFLQDPEFKAIVEEYANNESKFKEELAAAWTKLVNADRFDGPFKNACEGVDTPTTYPVQPEGHNLEDEG